MKDQFQRQIEYLRISVTDRCNLRCRYCMPEDGVQWLPHEDILDYEELTRIIRASTLLGFRRFRITGGEPLVRKGIVPFLAEVAAIPGVEDLMLTTNGILLADVADDLKRAGVNRVNISLDTLDPQRFKTITRWGKLSKVLDGVMASLRAGLHPVKVNVVVSRTQNLDELPGFLELARNYPLHVRFIELMPIGVSSDTRDEMVTIAEMKDILGLNDALPKIAVKGSGPAEYLGLSGYQGSIGFISALSRHFCDTCNRVRLTADGKLRPCLHSPQEYDLRSLLRSGVDDDELRRVFREIVWHKPDRHKMNDQHWQDVRQMSQIGG